MKKLLLLTALAFCLKGTCAAVQKLVSNSFDYTSDQNKKTLQKPFLFHKDFFSNLAGQTLTQGLNGKSWSSSIASPQAGIGLGGSVLSDIFKSVLSIEK